VEVLIHSETDVQHKIEIILSPEELKPHFEKAFREKAKEITLPGFRKGKAPLLMIQRHLGRAIEYETIEKLSNDLFQDALTERNIKPIGQPVLEDLDYKPGNALTIRISYEVAPEVVAKEYTGVQVEQWSHEVTGEEVEDELIYLQKRHRILEPAEVADEEGYLVTIELQMLNDKGFPIPGKVNDNLKIDLGEEHVNRDLKAELLNMRTGEEKDVELTYDNKDGQEETERAHIKVKSIERIILPDINDEFAKHASDGKHETLDAFRESLHENLVTYWKRRYEDKLKNDLVNEIIKRNPFAVPNAVVGNILDSFVEEVKQRYPEQKLPDDFNVEEYRTHREQEARMTAQWMYIRESIVEQEHLTVDDEAIERKAMDDAVRLGIDQERLLEYYRKSDQVRHDLVTDQLMDLLLRQADIKSVNDNDISQTALAPFEALAEQQTTDAEFTEIEEQPSEEHDEPESEPKA
jgi:trigger factor